MSAPRFFKDTTDGYEWKWDGRHMWINQNGDWYSSLFTSPDSILAEVDVIETDEFGNGLDLSTADIAAERGDREQQQEAGES